ncbi:Transglutaminase-like enzyme, putative cysteine protease [Thermodesulforhabdus norvegica]|uniref:Transglutaminase-like enzyme, putative cysteine protease n=2 Tax=Thermodesulforhabdus norvegica TaxID=39841 RepID=A0A1I4VEC5_9BACT|nr:Transglutaminase-like enzyme, putative cysteine protease [Thermodesulforhabdus norvegica]
MNLRQAIDILILFLSVFTVSLNWRIANTALTIISSIGLALEIAYRVAYGASLPIPRWLLNALGIGCVILTATRFSWENPLPPLVDCILLLMVIKWVERRNARDYLQMIALSLFQLVIYAFYTFDITFFIILLAVFYLGTLTLLLLTAFDGEKSLTRLESGFLKRSFMVSALQMILVLPVTTLLFFILPRTSTPILAFLQKPSVGRTGFTDNISLGEVGEIQESESIAFRATAEKLPDDKLYWRAIVFDFFDGKRWYASKAVRPDEELSERNYRNPDSQVVQVVLLEPHGEPYLVCLDVPVEVVTARKKVLISKESVVFMFRHPIWSRIKYTCKSLIEERPIPEPRSLAPYLQLPRNLSEDVKRLVEKLAVPERPELTLRHLAKWFRDNRFIYDLSNLPVSEDPLREFLFKTRRGNCEYFASAFGVMLRIAGIPTRLVGGYRGGKYNPLGGYYLVLHRDAHVWVEAYIDGQGWVRIDPVSFAVSEVAGMQKPSGFWLKLRLYGDIISYYWDQVVILYDVSKQMKLVNLVRFRMKLGRHFKMEWPDVKKAKQTLMMIVFFLAISGGFIVALRVRKHRLPEHARLCRAFERCLWRYGLERPPGMSLEEFVALLEGKAPASVVEQARRFVNLYSECLYKNSRFSEENVRELREIVKELRKGAGTTR